MKQSTKYFKEVATALASAKADEVEVKHSLPINREEYIKNEAKAIKSDLLAEYKKLCTHMKKSSGVLRDEIKNLPKVEQERIQKELVGAMEYIEKSDEDVKIEDDSLQAFLGLSNPTLLWIYQIAYRCFEENKHQEAQDLFFTLVLLNPMVRDYWMALGFAYEARCIHDRALEAFSFASLLDPEYAPSRFQCANIYLGEGDFDDALAELQVLGEIVDKQNLHTMRPQYETLLHKARNKKAS